MQIENEKTNKLYPQFLLKKDSNILYGIAILLMVFHHCFFLPDRLNYKYFPVFGGYEIESRIALMTKICVAIYAAITGYALSKKSAPYENGFLHLVYDFKISLCMLLKFYSILWLVCIIYLPIGAIFFNKTFTVASFLKMVLLGIGYNVEWWYVIQYIIFLIMFPFLETLSFLYEKKRKPVYLFIIILMTLLLAICVYFYTFFIFTTYIAIFFVLFFIGRLNIYEKINEKIKVPIFVCVLGIFLTLCVRWFIINNPFETRIDILITPINMFLLINIIHKFDFCKFNVLSYFGKHSTYIWLIHTFWIYYFFQDIIIFPYYSVLIYIWSITICLVNALLLDFIYHKFKIDKIIKKISLSILNK